MYAKQTTGGSASYATCLGSMSETYAITGMAPGGYDVAFVDPSGLHTTTRTTATVVANRTTSAVDADMPQVTAIVGTLVDGVSNVPIANGCAMLYAPGGGYVSGSYRCTDAQGKFVIDGIAPGHYLLAYYDPTARFRTLWFDGKPDQGSASVVTVTADTITTIGAARVATFGSATGIVRNADGTLASNVCVYANDMEGQYTGIGTCSDATGRYTLAGLLDGPVQDRLLPAWLGCDEPILVSPAKQRAERDTDHDRGSTDDHVAGRDPHHRRRLDATRPGHERHRELRQQLRPPQLDQPVGRRPRRRDDPAIRRAAWHRPVRPRARR